MLIAEPFGAKLKKKHMFLTGLLKSTTLFAIITIFFGDPRIGQNLKF